jgi:hypothetical protein
MQAARVSHPAVDEVRADRRDLAGRDDAGVVGEPPAIERPRLAVCGLTPAPPRCSRGLGLQIGYRRETWDVSTLNSDDKTTPCAVSGDLIFPINGYKPCGRRLWRSVAESPAPQGFALASNVGERREVASKFFGSR